MKKTIIIILLLIAVLAGYFAWQAYNKPVATLHDVKPEMEISAASLFAAFAENEDAAYRKYLGKIIHVYGSVLEIKQGDDYTTVYLDAEDLSGAVSCQLEKGEESRLKDVETGQMLNLIGKCTGLTMDVVLTQCIIIQ